MRRRLESQTARRPRSSSARARFRSTPRALEDRIGWRSRRTMDDRAAPGSTASSGDRGERRFGPRGWRSIRVRRIHLLRGRERACMRPSLLRCSMRARRFVRRHPTGFARNVPRAPFGVADERPEQRRAEGRGRSPSRQPDYAGAVPSISSTIAAVRFAAPGSPSPRLARSSASIWRSRASPWKSGASAAAIRSRVAAC